MIDVFIPKSVRVYAVHVHSFIPVKHNDRIPVLACSSVDKDCVFMTPFNMLGSLLLFVAKDDITDFIRTHLTSCADKDWKTLLIEFINGIASSEECLFHDELYDYVGNICLDRPSLGLLNNISSNLHDSIVAGIYKRSLGIRALTYIPVTTNKNTHLTLDDIDSLELHFSDKSKLKSQLNTIEMSNLSNPILLNSSIYLKSIGVYDIRTDKMQINNEQPIYTITNAFAKDLFYATINEYLKPTITFVVATYTKDQVDAILSLHDKLLMAISVGDLKTENAPTTLAWLTYYHLIFRNALRTQQDKDEVAVVFVYDASRTGKMLSRYTQQLTERRFSSLPDKTTGGPFLFVYWLLPHTYYPVFMQSILSDLENLKDLLSYFRTTITLTDHVILFQELLASKYSHVISDALETLHKQEDNRWQIIRIDSDRRLFTFELILRLLLTMQLEAILDRPLKNQLVNIVSSDYLCDAAKRDYINEYSIVVHPYTLISDRNEFVIETIQVKDCAIKHCYFTKSPEQFDTSKMINFDLGKLMPDDLPLISAEAFRAYSEHLPRTDLFKESVFARVASFEQV